MGKNGIYSSDRVFPPEFRCISCKHKMLFHRKECGIANCTCRIANPTFTWMISISNVLKYNRRDNNSVNI